MRKFISIPVSTTFKATGCISTPHLPLDGRIVHCRASPESHLQSAERRCESKVFVPPRENDAMIPGQGLNADRRIRSQARFVHFNSCAGSKTSVGKILLSRTLYQIRSFEMIYLYQRRWIDKSYLIDIQHSTRWQLFFIIIDFPRFGKIRPKKRNLATYLRVYKLSQF